MSLKYFRQLALEQLEQQCGSTTDSNYNNLVKYVITVPAIWKQSAKQFMRLAGNFLKKLKFNSLYSNLIVYKFYVYF